jgi:hypothetical protein
MCGAAAESIVLVIAVAKSGDADKVEKITSPRDGRGRIEKMILGGVVKSANDGFGGHMSLLN